MAILSLHKRTRYIWLSIKSIIPSFIHVPIKRVAEPDLAHTPLPHPPPAAPLEVDSSPPTKNLCTPWQRHRGLRDRQIVLRWVVASRRWNLCVWTQVGWWRRRRSMWSRRWGYQCRRQGLRTMVHESCWRRMGSRSVGGSMRRRGRRGKRG